MIVKVDPVTIVILSILLSWGWTEITTEPICKEEVIKQGVKYSVPIKCSEIPAS